MKKLFLLVTCLTLLAAACTFESTTDLYVQDVVDVQASGTTLYADAELAMEFSGDEAAQQQIVDLLEQYFVEVSNPHQEDRNSNTYLVVDHKMPLVYANAAAGIYALADVQANVFAFAVTPTDLNIAFNKTRFDQLNYGAE